MLPFLYSDPDASEETTGGGAAVAEEQTDTPSGESRAELEFDDASEQTQEPTTSPETPSKPTDAGEFVGLRQTAQ